MSKDTVQRLRNANPYRAAPTDDNPLLAKILGLPGDSRLTDLPPTYETRHRAPRRRLAAIGAVLVLLPVAGAAGVLTVEAFGGEPVTTGFSALDDTTLPPPPTDIMNGPTGFPALGHGPYEDARTVGDGMYLARSGDALCEFVVGALGQCTEHLPEGDVWLNGTMSREYDAETAPFQVYFCGFARDNIASIIVTTSTGATTTLPVVHNAFQTTLENTTFQDITSVDAVSTSGATTALDISAYSYTPPNLTQAAPPTTIAS